MDTETALTIPRATVSDGLFGGMSVIVVLGERSHLAIQMLTCLLFTHGIKVVSSYCAYPGEHPEIQIGDALVGNKSVDSARTKVIDDLNSRMSEVRQLCPQDLNLLVLEFLAKRFSREVVIIHVERSHLLLVCDTIVSIEAVIDTDLGIEQPVMSWAYYSSESRSPCKRIEFPGRFNRKSGLLRVNEVVLGLTFHSFPLDPAAGRIYELVYDCVSTLEQCKDLFLAQGIVDAMEIVARRIGVTYRADRQFFIFGKLETPSDLGELFSSLQTYFGDCCQDLLFALPRSISPEQLIQALGSLTEVRSLVLVPLPGSEAQAHYEVEALRAIKDILDCRFELEVVVKESFPHGYAVHTLLVDHHCSSAKGYNVGVIAGGEQVVNELVKYARFQ